MSLFSTIFKKNVQDSSINSNLQSINDVELESKDLELVEITNNGILDTSSLENIEKFKNNLKYLIDKAKKTKKIDKFMIIRDDNFFPYDWKWRVSSKDTGYEKVSLTLSTELKKQYALKKAGITSNINGINIPISEDEIQKAICKFNIDEQFGKVNLPVVFRSTKHFTVNTPLESTLNYNNVETNRNFTIIDNINFFIKSGYGYSVSYRDAYLDVSHEDLPISDEAIVLIEKSKYETIMKNPVISKQLSMRKVVVYTGDEYLAINMVLSELGVLPSTVGGMYANYDEETNKILKESIKKLASDNNLLYDKSHGGINGHFTDYYDTKNNDVNNEISHFVEFLKLEFKDYATLITEDNIKDKNYCSKIVQTIGIEKLISAIDKYNKITENNFNTNFQNYKEERDNVTPEISSIFKMTLNRIKNYYKNNENIFYPPELKEEIEENIRCFFQKSKIEEQLTAAKSLWKILENKNRYEVDNSDLEIEQSETKFSK